MNDGSEAVKSTLAIHESSQSSGIGSPEQAAWLQDRYNRLRLIIRRTTVDLVEFGRILTEVRSALPRSEFLSFVEAVGISQATAYRWIAAAGAAQGCSHVENIESTALYALAASSTPEDVREEFLRLADAGTQVTLQAVKASLDERREPKPAPKISYSERIVEAIVEADEANAGRTWLGRDKRVDHIAHEIERFTPESQVDVARSVDAWGRACVAAAAGFLTSDDPAA